MTTPQEKKVIARRLPEDIATGSLLNRINDICAPHIVSQSPLLGTAVGPSGIESEIEILQSAFPDFSDTVEEIMAERDHVAMKTSMRGTHEGEFLEFEPTGNTIEIGSMSLVRINDGKIVERWVYYDLVEILSQLGIMDSYRSQ